MRAPQSPGPPCMAFLFAHHIAKGLGTMRGKGETGRFWQILLCVVCAQAFLPVSPEVTRGNLVTRGYEGDLVLQEADGKHL